MIRLEERWHAQVRRCNTSCNTIEHGRIQVTNIANKLRKVSLETFTRSFICKVHEIFAHIPDSIQELGMNDSWLKVMKVGQRHINQISS